MAQIKTFRDLLVWQEAHELVLMAYRTTAKYPSHELFGLTSQSRRAAHSIATNIVEGFRRHTLKDSIHFYYISDASTEELKYHFLVAKDLEYIALEEYHSCLKQCEYVGILLTRWIQSQRQYL